MNYFNTTVSAAVSFDLENSWAAKSLQAALKQAQYAARFQAKQMQEKEEKMLKLYETQQQRAFERVGRSSAGSSISGGTSPVGAGKVRQMFDERRQKAGIDRSYPLEPLKQTKSLLANGNRASKDSLTKTTTTATKATFKSTVQRTVAQGKAGKPMATTTVRQSRHATYANGELIDDDETYEEFNGNGDPIRMMRDQQNDLELLMHNHKITDNLEDEEFPDLGYELDDGYRKPLPITNGNTKYRENEIKAITPPQHKEVAPRPPPVTKTVTKKPITKTTSSPVKTTNSVTSRSPSTPTNVQKSPLRSASSSASPKTTTKPSSSRSNRPASSGGDLPACKHCGRGFAPDRLGVHESICLKTLKKKRKAYDPVKHRVQGTDAENYIRKGKLPAQKTKKQDNSKSNWRQQHEEFINAIRAAKMAQSHIAAGGKLSDLPPPPPASNPDYKQCPHCGRRFNEGAAARHIPKCATMLHNKPKPSRK